MCKLPAISWPFDAARSNKELLLQVPSVITKTTFGGGVSLVAAPSCEQFACLHI